MCPALTKRALIKGRDEGYTLLELLVVIAIISLVVMAAPAIYASVIPSYELRQFANELAGAGRDLREQALVSGRPSSLLFDVDQDPDACLVEARSDSVRVVICSDDDTIAALRGEKRLLLDGIEVIFSGEEAYWGAPEERVDFYSNGASSGGSVLLRRGNLEVTVSYDWISGAVEAKQ